MGGGFGLTKALYVTTQCSGNLWVDSVLNKGTKITLEVPLSKNFTL
jgi:signal transduction histidine kinase